MILAEFERALTLFLLRDIVQVLSWIARFAHVLIHLK
jgi:hypothetical protein